MKKKVLFVTGTRADFGKLKPLISAVKASPKLEYRIFATGMHAIEKYGYTVDEIRKSGFTGIEVFSNQEHGDPMEVVMAKTMLGLSQYLKREKVDLLLVHGDRVEAVAAALVGALRNILTGHIEGGEVSGTIDGSFRHSISKVSHVHFVANQEAATRLKQMGEEEFSIHEIGSPDVDIMLSPNLPSLESVKAHYEIGFEKYGIVIFHSVTQEADSTATHATQLVEALRNSRRKYIVIYPNNDEGSDAIMKAYEPLEKDPNFRLFPSVRFESFLTLLKGASFLIGNSSAGVREAPVYGIPSINIGSRQTGRFQYSSIVNCGHSSQEIMEAIHRAGVMPAEPCLHFGSGNSAELFIKVLHSGQVWSTPIQKEFKDVAIDE